jgi:Protein of unknown function (DUF3551)
MRNTALALVALAAVSASAPAHAQSYDPNYPVCMKVYGPLNYNECRYTSLAQCQVSASGRAAQCVVNPYAANALAGPRRVRRGY